MPIWERVVRLLIVYSLVTYFVELEFSGAENSRQGHPFFLWSERVVACIFTVEYFWRWWKSGDRRWPFRLMSIIDLLAIVPFWIGFVVDARSLKLVRTLRMLRLFKLSRYSTALGKLRESFYSVRKPLQVIGLLVVFFLMIGSAAVYECEHVVQPDKFKTFDDALWWCIVTLTTVGYGELVPITRAGRAIAVVLLFAGLGLFGTFVSLVGGAFNKVLEQEREQPCLLSPEQLDRLAELLAEKLRRA